MKPVTDPALVAQLEKSAQPAPHPRVIGGAAPPDRLPTGIDGPEKPRYQSQGAVQVAPTGKREADPTRTVLSPSAVSRYGSIAAHGGEVPSLGMGGRADRAAIMNHASKQADREGIDPAEWTIRHSQMKGLNTQLTQLSRIYAGQGLAKDKATINGRMLADMVKHSVGVGGSNMPILNAIEQSARFHTGSPGVAEFRSSLKLYATEFAKVMTGGGNQALSDSARHEVDELLRANMTRAQLLRVINRMNVEMDNATAAYHHQITDITTQIHGLFQPAKKGGAKAPAKPVPQMQIRVISRRKVG